MLGYDSWQQEVWNLELGFGNSNHLELVTAQTSRLSSKHGNYIRKLTFMKITQVWQLWYTQDNGWHGVLVHGGSGNNALCFTSWLYYHFEWASFSDHSHILQPERCVVHNSLLKAFPLSQDRQGGAQRLWASCNTPGFHPVSARMK